jgi:hypothetical protein
MLALEDIVQVRSAARRRLEICALSGTLSGGSDALDLLLSVELGHGGSIGR